MYGTLSTHQRLYSARWVRNAVSASSPRNRSYSALDSGSSAVVVPSWSLTVADWPGPSATARTRSLPTTAKPSPLKRASTVVTLYRVANVPTRSVPSADVAVVTGEDAVTVRTVGSAPGLVRVRSVTATLSCVMNFRWCTLSPAAVCTLDQ